jgi:hypothetical protein
VCAGVRAREPAAGLVGRVCAGASESAADDAGQVVDGGFEGLDAPVQSLRLGARGGVGPGARRPASSPGAGVIGAGTAVSEIPG